MKKLGFVVLMVLFSIPMFAQCDQVVYDAANVMGSKVDEINVQAQQLTQLGADVRIRTVLNGSNLDLVENEMMKNCTSWQSASGGTKSTLLVLMVAPNEHKVGLYYGSAWHKALDDHWNRIKQQSMAPRFRDHDWAGGFIEGEHQLESRIKASQSEAITPVTSVTQEQPTDFSGLWKVLGWALGIFVFCLGVIFLYKLFSNYAEKKRLIKREQQIAINAREEARKRSQKAGGTAIEDYAQVAGQIKNDPTVDGKSADEYRLIAQAYSRIATETTDDYEFAPQKPKTNPNPLVSNPPKRKHKVAAQKEEVLEPIIQERVVERSSGDGITNFALGAVVGSELSRGDREDYREREDREDREDREARSSRSRDDDDDSRSSSSGGSSDWGSSDSGGGSSDFSSSGDSGGGSSDF